DTGEHRTVRHACRRKDHVPGGKIMQSIFAVEVGDPKPAGALTLLFVSKNQTRLDLPADAAQSRGGGPRLWCAARADIDVESRRRVRRSNDACDITVGDETDCSTGPPDALDDMGMARSIENKCRDIARLYTLCVGERDDVVTRRRIKIDDAFVVARA